MATTLEFGFEEKRGHAPGKRFSCFPPTQAHDVRVVVLTGELCRLLVVTYRRPNTLVTVCSDRNSYSGAANKDTPVSRSVRNRPDELVREIGVIYGLFTVGSKVENLATRRLDFFFNRLLQDPAAMVDSDPNRFF